MMKNFNSRAHVERDAIREERDGYKVNFNSRAHVERDPHGRTMRRTTKKNFNSRAHVERDPRCCCSWTLAPHDTDPILFGLQNIGAMFINR